MLRREFLVASGCLLPIRVPWIEPKMPEENPPTRMSPEEVSRLVKRFPELEGLRKFDWNANPPCSLVFNVKEGQSDPDRVTKIVNALEKGSFYLRFAYPVGKFDVQIIMVWSVAVAC